tara:strand:- start:107 stop:364 length:258 start_codon:yes stop_codon:yes gene_type:complete
MKGAHWPLAAWPKGVNFHANANFSATELVFGAGASASTALRRDAVMQLLFPFLSYQLRFLQHVLSLPPSLLCPWSTHLLSLLLVS